MASNKVRSKNDTWTTEELQMALKEEKSNRKGQDMASRRKQLREEEEKEARELKEARKAKRAEQNAKSRALIDEEEHRQRRREQKAKERNALDEDEEHRRRRHERKLKDGNMVEYNMEEEQKRRRHERKLKEAKEKDEEEQKRRRRERKLKEAKEEEERQKRHERKDKVKKIIANLEEEEEERRRRRHEKRKEQKELEKLDDEERLQKRHERKLKEGKLAEEDDEERRRKRRERKSKEENQEDEDENERRRKRHEKKSKDRNVENKDDEERIRKRHERKLKEGKLAEENAEERRHHKREHHGKKESNVSREETKSELDKNLDELKKTKRSKRKEYDDNENDDQQVRIAEVDIKPSSTPPTDLLETKVSDESINEDKYNYDEDFEDYSDDFDDDGDDDGDSASEKSSSKQESSADSHSRESTHISSAEKSSSSVNERPTYQVMDFSHAKLRKMNQKVKSKLQSRSDDLSSLIALDVSIGQDVFELAPISEYELYIRNFGKANSNQVYVQTGHDNVDRDIQTEEIESLDKWTQHPPNGPTVCGGNDDENLKPTDFVAKSQLQNSTRLNKFLIQATQMISILLEEDFSTSSHNLTPEKSSRMPFSKSFFTLSPCPLFQDYTIDCCCFANSLHADYILTVHNPPDNKNKEKKRSELSFLGSYVALWDLRTPSRPYKILYSESTISSCFGSLKSQLVLAGCVDGAVVVWDLRESESLHKHVNFDDMNFCVRYPSYNTASVLSFDSHCNIIQTIRDIPLQVDRQKETLIQKEGFNSGYTCQLLSMDQSGLINLWVIVEMPYIDSSGSQVDLGLSPGSRIKLEHTSSINIHTTLRDSLFSTSINTRQLCLLPKDPNQIYLSTDTGHIIHSVRLGSQPYPRVHCPRKATPSDGVPIHVLSLDFSPFMAPCFLTGHSDGSVNLYHTNHECPVVTWLPSQTGTKSIWSVRWSQSRPTVFYVCDDSSTIFVFDLLEQNNTPVCTNTYEERISSFNVICNTNDNNHTEKMILCFANGRIEVHHISERFSECQTLEMDFLENYLHRM